MINDKIITEKDRVPDALKIGQKYEADWARPGCVFILKAFLKDYKVIIETPKTKKQYETQASSLKLTKKDAYIKAYYRIKNANPQLKLF